ncbi:MAG: helix-turn-helix protein [Mucilaginibacter sp.]|nr:helix-turn-helix protein [Mucilaginibacter sp.]
MENLLGLKLKDLRENMNFSYQQLADQIGVAKQSVFKFEKGLSKPSTETLLKLSELFSVPYSLFYEDQEGANLDFENIRFRDAHKIFNVESHLKEVKDVVINYISKFLELERIMGYVRQFENPLEEVKINNEKDIEKAAKLLRKKWKIGNAPISDVVETLESKGVFVVEVSRTEDFCGLSGSLNKNVPIIVLNERSLTLERKRFTALHELGHIVLQFDEDFSEDKIEFYCNFFAGAVLIVDEALYAEFGRNRTLISLAELKRIKELYGISIQAIIIRARQTDFIDNKTSNDWWQAYNEWFSGGDNQNDFGHFKSNEKATRFNNMIVQGVAERRLSWSKAAELCGKKIDNLKKELNVLNFNVKN